MNTNSEKRELARQLWLVYFNRTLRDKGLITEQEYRKMHVMIYCTPIRTCCEKNP